MLKLNEDIFMTYGDGLSNVKIKNLIKFHYVNKALVTLTAVRPKERYGVIKISDHRISHFDNSKTKSNVYINGGFFVISKNVINLIEDKFTYWEDKPKNYAKEKSFMRLNITDFGTVDTMKDKNDLNDLYKKEISMENRN